MRYLLRFANPASNIDIFLVTFRTLYEALRSRQSFSFDDMTDVLIENNLVTSSGFTGEEAQRRGSNDDRSRDKLYNQSKMYSELFRHLGWIHPVEDSRNRFTFTHLGAHVAEASQDPRSIMREVLLGMAVPNGVMETRGDHELRPFKAMLLAAFELGCVICRDEIITGPLCLDDDTNPKAFERMIGELRDARRNRDGLAKLMAEVASTQSPGKALSNETKTNYTRFPNAALLWSGWFTYATPDEVSHLYPGLRPRPRFMKLTELGKKEAAKLKQQSDIRPSHVDGLRSEVLHALIRSTHYRMLERGGFELTDDVTTLVEADEGTLCDYAADHGRPDLEGRPLFSPMQQLTPSVVERVFPRVSGSIEAEDAREVSKLTAGVVTSRVTLAPANTDCHDVGRPQDDYPGREDIDTAIVAFGTDIAGLLDFLLTCFRHWGQDRFYPLVAGLFRELGYDCATSRQGVNSMRFDALITDEAESVPVEIKSPTEELNISTKAVRQALENKIVLMSRSVAPTKRETTSLVVGYLPPNNRAEVARLVEDFQGAYGINIGVIDLRSLLSLVIEERLQGKRHDRTELRRLYGFIEVTNS